MIEDDLENIESYGLKEIIRGVESYYLLIKKLDPYFFSENIDIKQYLPVEIEKTIFTGKIILNNKNKGFIAVLSNKSIQNAIEEIEFYKQKITKTGYDKRMSSFLYSNLLELINALNQLVLIIKRNKIESKIISLEFPKILTFLTLERQKLKYQSFSSFYIKNIKEYLTSRISDFNELRHIEESNYSSDLKEIVNSYNKAIKINIKGKDLQGPLMNSNLELFSENLEKALYIPSFFDITKTDKERIYHIYLLGLLEGRVVFYNLFSNRESGSGRYDICLSPINNSNPGVIIEIKKSNNKLSKDKIEQFLNDAITQIKANSYYNDLINKGIIRIFFIAILFQGSKPYLKYENFNIE